MMTLYFGTWKTYGISHKTCNCSAGAAASGKFEYTGVCEISPSAKCRLGGIRAEICLHSKQKLLGLYKTAEEAAMAYDLGLLIFRNGIGKLNFPSLREKYLEYIKIGPLNNINKSNVDQFKGTRIFTNMVRETVKTVQKYANDNKELLNSDVK